ncbi:methyltransferase domain-containing protein [Microbacterium sp. H1-D42]|uniref:methyltransferase domain-containing protein n=1 Tax=Microbacterium sp. H1-D42 TaxID=2925844 RepID=UPI001F53C13A|nr:methyltransferase domain-containing protein [Microbacterium sp. H1-D42]UNK72092.1 methyltransferase domain-containing protein [Microbacterium sp. H1-D42]
MVADLRTRAVDASEQMDAPDADSRMLARTYAQFGAVNTIVSGAGDVYRRHVRPRASRQSARQTLRVLDIGCGGGDQTRAVARRLQRDGYRAQVTGIDIEQRAIDWSSRADDEGLVRWRCASSTDLVHEGEPFDVVLSNHVLHHLTAHELTRLLADSRRLAREGGVVVHSDIARSRAAYLLFAVATWPFAGSLLADSFIRADGLTSIRRSYTRGELAAVVPDGWHVEQRMPARLLLNWSETG